MIRVKIVLKNERPKSWNTYWSGMHWTERSDEARRVHILVKYSLKPEQRKLITGRVDIFTTVYFKNRPYDSDNIAAKPYIDGLKGIILPDDTMKYVGFTATRSEVDKKNPRVEIEILDHTDSIPPRKRI